MGENILEIIAAVGGVASFFGILISQILFYRKDERKMDDIHASVKEAHHAIESRTEKEHEDLVRGHGDLSKEHSKLNINQMEVKKDISDIKPKVEKILVDTQKLSLIQDRQEQTEKHMPSEAALMQMVSEVYKNQMQEITNLQQIHQREVEQIQKEMRHEIEKREEKIKKLEEEKRNLQGQIDRQREMEEKNNLYFGKRDGRDDGLEL